MKKLISLLMVAVLAFSCTACGTIGGPPSSDVGNDTPVISTDFETYDVSTKDGLHDAVIHSPDYNTKDDFWYYFYGDKIYNRTDKAYMLRSPGYFNLSSLVLGTNYAAEYPYPKIEAEYLVGRFLKDSRRFRGWEPIGTGL